MDDYETLSKIGDGAFGTVYLCKRRLQLDGAANTTDDNLVAIKKMKKRYYNWQDCMKLREIIALKRLNHPNVILLKEVIREENHLYLVFEHMEENLYQLIRSQLNGFHESTIQKIVYQILNGLAYIHRHGFFHRDIKPENLLCRNEGQIIKIADFGLTREIDSEPPYTDYVSTRWYRAPELLLHSTHYDSAVDIWAVGCIASELYTLRPTFPGRSEMDQIFKICHILGPPNVTNWPEGQRLASLIQVNFPNLAPLDPAEVLAGGSCSMIGIEFIKSMLKWIPGNRPSASELLHHIYFATASCLD